MGFLLLVVFNIRQRVDHVDRATIEEGRKAKQDGNESRGNADERNIAARFREGERIAHDDCHVVDLGFQPCDAIVGPKIESLPFVQEARG